MSDQPEIEHEELTPLMAAHIPNAEAIELIQYLNEELGDKIVKFYPGVSYRHLLVIKGKKSQIQYGHGLQGINPK